MLIISLPSQGSVGILHAVPAGPVDAETKTTLPCPQAVQG